MEQHEIERRIYQLEADERNRIISDPSEYRYTHRIQLLERKVNDNLTTNIFVQYGALISTAFIIIGGIYNDSNLIGFSGIIMASVYMYSFLVRYR